MRDQHDASASVTNRSVERGNPRSANREIPITLLYAHNVRMQRFPPRLPMQRPRIAITWKHQHAARHGASLANVGVNACALAHKVQTAAGCLANPDETDNIRSSMKMKTLLVAAVVASSLVACKKDSSAPPPATSGGDCAGAMAVSMKFADEEMATMPAAMKGMMKSTMDLMGKLCVDDKWSAATTDCLKAATSSPASRACMGKLTPAQTKSMTEAMQAVMNKMLTANPQVQPTPPAAPTPEAPTPPEPAPEAK